MPTTTTVQGIRVPLTTDDPDIVDDLTKAVEGIETKLMMVFNSAADRNSKISVPTEGMFAYLKDSNTVTYYDGDAWSSFLPELPSFTSGTTLPSSASEGDVHFKTEA